MYQNNREMETQLMENTIKILKDQQFMKQNINQFILYQYMLRVVQL